MDRFDVEFVVAVGRWCAGKEGDAGAGCFRQEVDKGACNLNERPVRTKNCIQHGYKIDRQVAYRSWDSGVRTVFLAIAWRRSWYSLS